jgi:hypothetical protein
MYNGQLLPRDGTRARIYERRLCYTLHDISLGEEIKLLLSLEFLYELHGHDHGVSIYLLWLYVEFKTRVEIYTGIPGPKANSK